MPLTPEQRTMRARLAAHSMHAKGGTNTGPARKAFEERFDNEVDPDRVLPPAERARRAANARAAYFTRLSFNAAKARQAKAATS